MHETRNARHAVILVAILAVIASQELLEILAIERTEVSSGLGLAPLILNLGQVLAILAASFVGLRLWRDKAAEAELAAHRCSELERSLAALQRRQVDLLARTERLATEREEEERLLAYEIHDGLAQVIVSAKQHLDTFEDVWKIDPAEASVELETALERLGRAVVETRLLLATLRPGRLATVGLVAILRDVVARVARDAGWKTEFTADLHGQPLPPAVETAAFRIVHEALTNVARHARTSRVSVELGIKDGHLFVDVTDYGTGFESPPGRGRREGAGLASMRERARLVGGRCDIESRPGETRVLVIIPVKSDDGARI